MQTISNGQKGGREEKQKVFFHLFYSLVYSKDNFFKTAGKNRELFSLWKDFEAFFIRVLLSLFGGIYKMPFCMKIQSITRCRLALCFLLLMTGSTAWSQVISTNLGHPRLYVTAREVLRLRAAHDNLHAKIWSNLVQSADWCLTKTPCTNWIPPVSPDPVYENLYDRFYGIMGDMAIMEHLAFAYALSGNPAYGEAARKWVLNSCRVWQHEGDGVPDGGKAYAVSRLLKGIAVGYDLVYDQFSDAERKEIRDTLARIGGFSHASCHRRMGVVWRDGPDSHGRNAGSSNLG